MSFVIWLLLFLTTNIFFCFFLTLTALLPRHHLKMANKSLKSESLKPFCRLFCTGMWKDFYQNRYWQCTTNLKLQGTNLQKRLLLHRSKCTVKSVALTHRLVSMWHQARRHHCPRCCRWVLTSTWRIWRTSALRPAKSMPWRRSVIDSHWHTNLELIVCLLAGFVRPDFQPV